MSHKVEQVSHAELHNHLTGQDKLDLSNFKDVVSIRKDKLESFINNGYEIISSSEDAVLVGKRK